MKMRICDCAFSTGKARGCNFFSLLLPHSACFTSWHSMHPSSSFFLPSVHPFWGGPFFLVERRRRKRSLSCHCHQNRRKEGGREGKEEPFSRPFPFFASSPVFSLSLSASLFSFRQIVQQSVPAKRERTLINAGRKKFTESTEKYMSAVSLKVGG